MKRVFVVFSLIGILALAGCSYVHVEPAKQSNIDKMISQTFEKLADDQWTVLGFVEIDGYHAGAEVQQTIYLLNNLKTNITEVKLIKTFADEVTAEIPINRKLHANNVENVVEITSSIDETLTATGYNYKNSTLIITGFTPESERTASITYRYDSRFTFSVINTEEPRRGYRVAPNGIADWVTFDDAEPFVDPCASKPVIVTMIVPQGTELPRRWEFWIVVHDNPLGAQLNQQIEYKIPWVIDMR